MVRFQLPELSTEVIRLDEESVLKTGGGAMSLVSSSLTASARTHARAHRPTGRRQLRKLEIRVRFSVSPLKWKVAGYGWPGRSAKAVLARRDEGSSPLPSAARTGCWSNGTTSPSHGGDRGSIPRRSTGERERVQSALPPGLLTWEARYRACGFNSRRFR